MAGTDTITMYKGEDVTLSFTMTPTEDITGWAIEFNLRKPDGTVVNKTATVTNGPSGLFSVSLADTDTETLTLGLYDYDAWRVDAGLERVLAKGVLNLLGVARSL